MLNFEQRSIIQGKPKGRFRRDVAPSIWLFKEWDLKFKETSSLVDQTKEMLLTDRGPMIL